MYNKKCSSFYIKYLILEVGACLQSCDFFPSAFQQYLAKLTLISELLLDKTLICLFSTPTPKDITLH